MSSITFVSLSFLLLFVPLIAESITSWGAIKTVQKRFPGLWKHSGSPTLLGNGDLTKAWPLVKYYRDRAYLGGVTYDGIELPPMKDPEAIEFAEKLRAPLLLTYWAAWVGVGAFLIVLIGGGVLFF